MGPYGGKVSDDTFFSTVFPVTVKIALIAIVLQHSSEHDRNVQDVTRVHSIYNYSIANVVLRKGFNFHLTQGKTDNLRLCNVITLMIYRKHHHDKKW